MSKLESILEDFEKVVKRLDSVLQQDENEFIRDSAIQRFEFTFDLSWKALKTLLEEKYGVMCASPKTCFREAYKQALIDYDDFWLEMTDWRNKTSHTYREDMANEILKILPKALTYFKNLLATIRGT